MADLARNFPRRTQGFRRANGDGGQNTDSENQHADLGTLARFLINMIGRGNMQFRVLARLHAMDELGIFFEFTAAPVHRQASGQQSDEIRGHGNRQNVEQCVAVSGHNAHHGSHGGTHGAGHHADTGADHRR